jgi:hypothetical protein
MKTNKLIIASIITAFISMTAVFLVSYAIKGYSIDGIVTAFSIGVGSGFGVFLVYRKRPVKGCSFTRKQPD